MLQLHLRTELTILKSYRSKEFCKLADHPLALCCHYPVSKCRSALMAVTGTLRVNLKQDVQHGIVVFGALLP